MNSFLRDCRIGVRYFVRHPGLAIVCILILAAGIGTSTTVFSLVDAVLLKPLSYPQSSRLYIISESVPQLGFSAGTISAADFNYFREKQQSMESVAAFQNDDFELSGVSQPERVIGARVTASLFQVLQVKAFIGRTFTPEEDQPGVNVVVMGYGLWQRRYGADPSIIGKPIRLNRVPYMVIGVMPQDFKFPVQGPLINARSADLWVPIAFTPTDLQSWGVRYNYTALGRLKSNVTLSVAQTEVTHLAGQIQGQYPAVLAQYMHGAKLFVSLSSYHEEIVGKARVFLLLLFGAVVLVLGVGCANLGSLLLAHAVSRKKEMAIRWAIGASYPTLLRQLFAENLILAATGGALGWLLAFLGRAWVKSVLPSNLVVPNDASFGGTVFAFAAIISLASCLLFAAMPALLLRSKLGDALHEAGSSRAIGRRGRRMQAALVTTQFALSVLLLIGAGLLLRSFKNLLDVNPGFQSNGVIAVRLPLPFESYPKAAQIRSFYEEVLNGMASFQGIETAGLASDLPLHAKDLSAFQIEGAKDNGGMTPPSVHLSWVMGKYFEAIRVPLVKGRVFTPNDRQGTLPVALINASMARQFWPGDDPVGKRLRWAGGSAWLTIVGVVDNIKDDGLRDASVAHVYAPYLQQEDAFVEDTTVGELRNMNMVVRTRGTVADAVTYIDRTVHHVDPDVALTKMHTLSDDLQTSVSTERFSALIISLVAGVALFLAAIGVYGVIAFAVVQQTRDIGVRMALGAQRSSVVGMVVKSGLRMSTIGTLLGLIGAWWLTAYLRTLLYSVRPDDPVIFISSPLVLMLVALLACYVPARRATRIDPLKALRYE